MYLRAIEETDLALAKAQMFCLLIIRDNFRRLGTNVERTLKGTPRTGNDTLQWRAKI